MTVSSLTNKNTYAGDGSTTVFNFTFKILKEEDILVQTVNASTVTTLSLTTDYTVSGTGNSVGRTNYTSGTVTLTTAPASGVSIVVKRSVDLLQEVDLLENDSLPAETLEESIDKLTMITQQLQETDTQSIAFNSAVTTTVGELGTPTGDRYLKRNAANDGWEFAQLSTSAGLGNVVEDTSPQLGGDLDVNNNNITGTGNINLTGTITASNFGGPTADDNLLLNGGFNIWQRGTGLTLSGSTATYLADRWLSQRATGTTDINRRAFTAGQTDVPNNPTYYYEIDKSSAEVSATVPLEQRIEDVTALSGQTITVSFWAKCDANKTFQVQVNQNFGSGGSTAVGALSQNIEVTTTWQKFTVTGTLPSVSGKTIGTDSFTALSILELSGFSTFTLSVANAQVTNKSYDPPYFKRSVADDLRLCQRYFFGLEASAATVLPTRKINAASAGAVTASTFTLTLHKVWEMRATPTVTNVTASNITLNSESGGVIATATAAPTILVNPAMMSLSFGSADISDITQIRFGGDAPWFDAEI